MAIIWGSTQNVVFRYAVILKTRLCLHIAQQTDAHASPVWALLCSTNASSGRLLCLVSSVSLLQANIPPHDHINLPARYGPLHEAYGPPSAPLAFPSNQYCLTYVLQLDLSTAVAPLRQQLASGKAGPMRISFYNHSSFNLTIAQ